MTAVMSIDDRSDEPVSRQICYDLEMIHRASETGALQVFRVYGWLHLTPILLFPLLNMIRLVEPTFWLEGLHSPVDQFDHILATPDLRLPLAFSVIHSLILLGYLYTPGLHRKLGRWYLPLAIVFATTALIIEQRLFFPSLAFFQIHPFLNILLILVAWIYGFRAVLAYTTGSILLEIVMNLYFPATLIYLRMSSDWNDGFSTRSLVWIGDLAFSYFSGAGLRRQPVGFISAPAEPGISRGESETGAPRSGARAASPPAGSAYGFRASCMTPWRIH